MTEKKGDVTAEERGFIKGLIAGGFSDRKIALQVGRGRATIARIRKNPAAESARSKSGRKAMLSPREKRAITRRASEADLFARDIRNEMDLGVSVRTVQKVLADCEFLDFRKADLQHNMTQQHREWRFNWAEEHATWSKEVWDLVMFSDEKKFNLDGPDGLAFYWWDIRKEERIFQRRQKGGGGVMVWGSFSAKGQSELSILKGNQNAQRYTNTLENYLLPFAESMHPNGYIFQQDSASIHTASHTKRWFDTKNVTVLDWAPKSPDLNPIENVWGQLARSVYANMRQFSTVADLTACVLEEWDSLDISYLQKLSHSMPRRCAKIMRAQGKALDY